MNDSKYRTIDPLILQTLNLNQERMNHILNIIHGKQDHNYAKTERKAIRPLIKNRTISSINQNDSILPPIHSKERKSNQRITERQSPSRFFTLNKNKSNQQLITDQSIDKSRTTQKRQKVPKRYQSNFKSQNKLKKSEKDLVNIQEQISRVQVRKKEQIIKNYMMSNIKRSKSQDLNPKDIYRMQIESIVAQLTPIEQLEEQEKKMGRLKRRYKHLFNFDKNYYLRINQIDMLNLPSF